MLDRNKQLRINEKILNHVVSVEQPLDLVSDLSFIEI